MKLLFLIFLILVIGNIEAFGSPYVVDQNFVVEKYIANLTMPTTMSFIENDLLVLEKTTGNVRLVRNGTLQNEPVLHVNVEYIGEQGLLGIASVNSTVYLYYTEAETQGGKAIANRIYEYTWNGQTLEDPELLRELPINVKYKEHNGGAMVTNNDGTFFVVIGDIDKKGVLQNFESGNVDDTSVILHVDSRDKVLKPSLSENFLEHYYAIGIRNSFGLAIDPVTKYLWDTENGVHDFDEINLVKHGFNSGWEKIMGPSNQIELNNLPKFYDFQYSDPEFSWEETVGPTAITFMDSKEFEKYRYSIIVGSFHHGIIYQFKLNEERTGFVFDNIELSDLVANKGDNIDETIFGLGFGGITDIEIGPDGNLYVLSLTDGMIYKILPNEGEKIQKRLSVNCDDIAQPGVNWASCQLMNRNLSEIDLRLSNLTKVNLFNAELQNSDLSFANLEGANLHGADLNNADLLSVNLQNSDLSYSNLEGANLQDADLSNADLSFANLEGANLFGANLTDANFSLSNLADANLARTYLHDTKFYKANLTKTDLPSDIENADFTDAFFYKTKIHTCFGNETLYWTLHGWLLRIQDLHFLWPIEWLIPKFCGPHYYIDLKNE